MFRSRTLTVSAYGGLSYGLDRAFIIVLLKDKTIMHLSGADHNFALHIAEQRRVDLLKWVVLASAGAELSTTTPGSARRKSSATRKRGNMETYLVIERRGNQNDERAVRIVQWRHDGGPLRTMLGSWSVDPRREVKNINGCARRRGRIHSFITGLCCAGHAVYMNIQFDDDQSSNGIRPVQLTQPVKNLHCWFVGLAWGLGRWDELAHALKTYFPPHKRAAVLDMTAQHYWAQPFERPLYLRFPASW